MPKIFQDVEVVSCLSILGLTVLHLFFDKLKWNIFYIKYFDLSTYVLLLSLLKLLYVERNGAKWGEHLWPQKCTKSGYSSFCFRTLRHFSLSLSLSYYQSLSHSVRHICSHSLSTSVTRWLDYLLNNLPLIPMDENRTSGKYFSPKLAKNVAKYLTLKTAQVFYVLPKGQNFTQIWSHCSLPIFKPAHSLSLSLSLSMCLTQCNTLLHYLSLFHQFSLYLTICSHLSQSSSLFPSQSKANHHRCIQFIKS